VHPCSMTMTRILLTSGLLVVGSVKENVPPDSVPLAALALAVAELPAGLWALPVAELLLCPLKLAAEPQPARTRVINPRETLRCWRSFGMIMDGPFKLALLQLRGYLSAEQDSYRHFF